jgi:amino acid transporter
VVAGITGNPMGGTSVLPYIPQTHKTFVLLSGATGVLGVIGSVPAIAFSFDGFYTAAGMQSEMKEPEKTPKALVFGLLLVAVIDLLVAVSLLIGTSSANMGKVSGLALIPH